MRDWDKIKCVIEWVHPPAKQIDKSPSKNAQIRAVITKVMSN